MTHNKIIIKNKKMFKTYKKNFCLIKKIFGADALKFQNGEQIKLQNYINGKWQSSKNNSTIPNPLTGLPLYSCPSSLTPQELQKIKSSMLKCKKSGLHNPFKNPERYRGWGEILQRAVELLHNPIVHNHFINITEKVMPKSKFQIEGELIVTRRFLENFIGDNSRFGLRGFNVAGDSEGQMSNGFRFPYGPVALIAPFNFPYEIPVLQSVGALVAGNKILIKGDSRVSVVLEHFYRLLEYCGMYSDAVTFLHCDNRSMEELLLSLKGHLRTLHFTGSSKVALHLSGLLDGKVRFEDSGFNWKILGPDVGNVDWVVSQSDQDAYASGGQKCSAQSMLFVHENWLQTNFLEGIKTRANQRSLKNLTNSPILTMTNEQISSHCKDVLSIPGSKLLFGGEIIKESHKIPSIYGSFQPTAIQVPLEALKNINYLKICSKEIFGPFQIVTTYAEKEKSQILDILESFEHHLTAGIVSNDVNFINYFLKNSVNGVTYVGRKARTTGAPQNHWFGPSNDPRGSGIGTIEAIKDTWTAHREIVYDFGPCDGEIDPVEQS